MDDVIYSYYEDIRSKKRTATGAYHKASKRHSKFVHKSLKYKSEMRVYNMYSKYDDVSNCPSLNELVQNTNREEVKNILTYLKSKHTNKVLCAHFKCSSGKLYSTFDKFEVKTSKKIKKTYPKSKKIEKVDQILKPEIKQESNNVDMNAILEKLRGFIKEENSMINNKKTFNISINGVYDKEALGNKLLSITEVFDIAEKYQVSISISEVV